MFLANSKVFPYEKLVFLKKHLGSLSSWLTDFQILYSNITTWKVSRFGVFSGAHLPVFRLQTEYGDLLRKSLYLVRIQENTDQKKLCFCTLFKQCMFSINQVILILLFYLSMNGLCGENKEHYFQEVLFNDNLAFLLPWLTCP